MIDIQEGGWTDVVPYEEIEHIHYNLGKHVFLSVTLHHAARKPPRGRAARPRPRGQHRGRRQAPRLRRLLWQA